MAKLAALLQSLFHGAHYPHRLADPIRAQTKRLCHTEAVEEENQLDHVVPPLAGYPLGCQRSNFHHSAVCYWSLDACCSNQLGRVPERSIGRSAISDLGLAN